MDQTSQILMTLGGLFFLGLLADAIGRRTPIPRVSLLILFGFFIGNSGLDLLTPKIQSWFPLITDIALSMVAFLLGGKLSLSFFKRHGHSVIGVSIVVTLATCLIVTITLAWSGMSWQNALLLGAIATATAPAAVSDVIRELRAQGDFTKTLIGIVTVDDIWGVALFSIVLALVQLLNGGSDPLAALWHGCYDIFGAIALGTLLGIPLAYMTGRVKNGDPTVSEAIGAVCLCGGLARYFDVSFLLSAITMGAVIVNLAKHHSRPFHAIQNIEWPFISLFFVLAGAALEIDQLSTLGWALAVYITSRIIGRLIGAYLGAKLSNLPKLYQHWMGVALLPQAGVAIGMILVATEKYPHIGDSLLPLVISATIFFELVGPILTRMAIESAGENR